jgi:hypothetical protein
LAVSDSTLDGRRTGTHTHNSHINSSTVRANSVDELGKDRFMRSSKRWLSILTVSSLMLLLLLAGTNMVGCGQSKSGPSKGGGDGDGAPRGGDGDGDGDVSYRVTQVEYYA